MDSPTPDLAAEKSVQRTSFDELTVLYYPQVLGAARLMTGNRSEAEDLAQETFWQALSAWPRFDGSRSPRAWLYGILLNQDRKRRRSLSRGWRRVVSWFESQVRTVDSPEGRMVDEEWRRSLWSEVERLSDPLRAVVLLRFAEGMCNEEIAEVPACPIGTVKSRIHHALKRLAQVTDQQMVELLPTSENPYDRQSFCSNESSL